MSLFKRKPTFENLTDENLVLQSLGGDQQAFCEIVVRYQNLLCSIAFSSIGDIKHSEDIAQEAFVEAWKKLESLRDPEKLKSWLCGILRFKVSHHKRKTMSQNEVQDISDEALSKVELEALEKEAINEQEQALLWTTLSKMEETYREPLVLFYREGQSIERVAQELELSKDTVKQRLSRGRKLLKEAMSTFVEDALANSKPSIAFTVGVMTLISSISPPAKAAIIGAGAYKTGALSKFAWFISILAPLAGIISSFFSLRATLDQSRTPNERTNAYKTVASFFVSAIIYTLIMFTLIELASGGNNKSMYIFLANATVFTFIASYFLLVKRMLSKLPALRAQERIAFPHLFTAINDAKDNKSKTFISEQHLFGIPLIHIQFGTPELNDSAAIGWIAGGSKAYGLLFAWGGFAVAPISVGIISVGILSVGAVSIGLLALGTVAIGLIGFGASAIAYKAYASLSSLGWESAFSNGFSYAIHGAIGPIALAEDVNNEAANDWVNLALFSQSYTLMLAIICILVIVPAVWYATKVRQRMKR